MDAHDVHDAREVVGQHVQRHLGGNPWQCLHQEVCGSHPGFDRAEGMLDRLAPLAHLLGMLVEPALDGLENILMLPTRDPALAARRALGLERTAQTGCRPIATQRLAVFLVRIPIGQPLAGRATIDIVLDDIDEVLLAKAPFGLGARGIGLGSVTVMPASSQARISWLSK